MVVSSVEKMENEKIPNPCYQSESEPCTKLGALLGSWGRSEGQSVKEYGFNLARGKAN